MATLVPMPKGVILNPALVADWRPWWHLVKCNMRVRGKWYRPIKSLRSAIYTANHGRKNTGEIYRSCYRLKWLEGKPSSG